MNTKARIKKWGNSYAVRIPSLFAKQVGLELEDEVDMEVSIYGIIIKKPRRTLDAMVSEIDESNMHAETEWGGPQGNEIW